MNLASVLGYVILLILIILIMPIRFFHLMETGQGELFKLLVKNYERNVDNNIVKEEKKRDKKWFHFLWNRKKELESTATEAEHGNGNGAMHMPTMGNTSICPPPHIIQIFL